MRNCASLFLRRFENVHQGVRTWASTYLNSNIMEGAITSTNFKSTYIKYAMADSNKVILTPNKTGLYNVDKISDFYKNANIFITGGTGFIGKSLIEKLLRTCQDLDTIYVLVRAKKGVKPRDRLNALFSNPVFNIIKKTSPEVLQKVRTVEGDIKMPHLGMSLEDINMLVNKVNVVFHSAATIRFNERLSDALEMNTLGSKQMAELSCKMKNIKSFVYVSTAFCNCEKSEINEVVYKPDHDPEDVLDLLQTSVDKVNELSSFYLEKHPNTYTFSKALNEYLIASYSNRLPISIVRPSIVTSAWKDPFPGWIDGWSLMNSLTGQMHRGAGNLVFCDKDIIIDMIPVDIVTDTLITSAWHIHHQKSDSVNVYNCTTGTVNGILVGKAIQIVEKIAINYPGMHTMYYPNVSTTKLQAVQSFYSFVFGSLPALWKDIRSILNHEKPTAYEMKKRLDKVGEVMAYFLFHEYKFEYNNMDKLRKALLSAKDGHNFNVDISLENKFVWEDYFKDYVFGIQKYLFKEDLKDLPRAKYRLSKIYWYTQGVKAVIYALAVYFLYNVLLLIGF